MQMVLCTILHFSFMSPFKTPFFRLRRLLLKSPREAIAISREKMASESKNSAVESVVLPDSETKNTKKRKGILSRIWNALFRVREDDYGKRLEHISKEEAAVLARITRRSNNLRRMTRHFIVFSVLIEVIAVSFAITTTRSLNLNWQTRALRVLPMFLLPALSFITYSTLRSFSRMRDGKDHKTLEKLRAERQAKIDELKEKTNYYITQQLIQRYDPDPAAKAAAATVLASKLGADSGLKVYVADDSNPTASTGKSKDVELASNTTGLRQRKQSHKKTNSTESSHSAGFEGVDLSQQQHQHQHQLVVEHHPQAGLTSNDGGWIARLAALLVGEDPAHSYALICGNCHMHNGLARKEDFPYVTYYCPHCNALNRPKQSDDRVFVSGSATPTSMAANADNNDNVVGSPGGSTVEEISPSATHVANATQTSES
ncbi:Protein of unknown function (DUF2296 [Striga hermonthica]|uniref:Lunapark zinc ribbon domain-containing protein n=1 Tax=Striga hermonthica TaxID=68872 RepID=A0A9N7MJZ4_STRHE|nr:Protein of unknown function (DUF2296 [Striga hermonthica]